MELKQKKSIITFLLIFLLCSGFIFTPSISALSSEKNGTVEVMSETVYFSQIIIEESNNQIKINLPEANSWTVKPNDLKLPTVAKIYEFPIGTEIIDISVESGNMHTFLAEKTIETVPLFHDINSKITLGDNNKMEPLSSYTFHTGVGLNKENKNVLFLTLTIHPIQYDRESNNILQMESATIEIKYNLIQKSLISAENANETYDIVVITPQSYKSLLYPYVQHKNQYGLNVYIQTLDNIYSSFQGRDDAEKIKYFVKYAVEEWNTLYVLLIGDKKSCPIRATDAYPWEGYHGNGILSDLYYSDLYDSSFEFCSWDGNQNNIFGEIDYQGFPPEADDDMDNVDLYADVHIGRIPCRTSEELSTVLNKIITYETVTYNQIWFQKIILMGGDTFPLTKMSPPFVYEGEITNIKVGQQLPEFEQVRLWASTRNLHAWTFNREISKGAGFVSYAGHGFEHGWGTYRPNAIIDGNLIFYYSPFLNALSNGHKLPIVFFDACLTAKLDFNITDLVGYYGLKAQLIGRLLGGFTADDYFDPFAWSMLKLEGGGCVANVGATRPAYTYVDKDGVYAGAGYLDVHFFKAYEEGVTAGEMLTSAQRDYLNNVGLDYFTIEEYMLLGDPSLMVGGYP